MSNIDEITRIETGKTTSGDSPHTAEIDQHIVPRHRDAQCTKMCQWSDRYRSNLPGRGEKEDEHHSSFSLDGLLADAVSFANLNSNFITKIKGKSSRNIRCSPIETSEKCSWLVWWKCIWTAFYGKSALWSITWKMRVVQWDFHSPMFPLQYHSVCSIVETDPVLIPASNDSRHRSRRDERWETKANVPIRVQTSRRRISELCFCSLSFALGCNAGKRVCERKLVDVRSNLVSDVALKRSLRGERNRLNCGVSSREERWTQQRASPCRSYRMCRGSSSIWKADWAVSIMYCCSWSSPG